MKRLVISSDPFVVKAALIENGKLATLVIKRKTYSNDAVVGNVYKGIIKDVVPNIGAAFVEIGLDKKAFMCIDSHCIDNIRSNGINIKEGEEVLVQVYKPIVSSKGAKVTPNITIAGNYLVLLRNSNFIGVSKHIEDKAKSKWLRNFLSNLREDNIGFIARTASRFAAEDELVREAEYLKSINREISQKFATAKAPALIYEEPQLPIRVIREYCDYTTDEIVFDDADVYKKTKDYLNITSNRCADRVALYEGDKPIFEYFGIMDEIKNLQSNVVHLKSGGYLIIEKTEAFFAIDVNSGSYHYHTDEPEESIFRINLEAAYEIFKQINLRDLGGLIIVDFIDMSSKEHIERLQDVLFKLAKNDKRKTYVSKMSELGVIEISRRKSNTDIFDEMFDKCPDCYNGGLVKSIPLVCSEIYEKIKYSNKKRFRLKAPLSVVEHFKAYMPNWNKHIEFITTHSCNVEDYTLEVLP
ncbi:Rne/Rng family ribonuclease [Hippea alviniae]|uniref:Rne/Rng family ribonuclease n=1 Tax=Hippea alviniae TaxID=1279027 RepID=UPI0003B52AB9|nr:Rne/Rng family ribonuclease [Hippea alviniae]